MKTLALRLYGKKDLRLEEFELPEIAEDEILADITTDSICMSTYKAAIQGTDHKRVPKDIAQNPVIVYPSLIHLFQQFLTAGIPEDERHGCD